MKLRLLLLNIISIVTNFYSFVVRNRKKNILIFRCGGLGDFLLETVAIHRLRAEFPAEQYKIFYVHRKLNAETIPQIIPVDQVIVLDEKNFFTILISAVKMWKHRYELSVNMSDPRYPLLHRILERCRAKKKVTYDYPECRFTAGEFEKFRPGYDVLVKFSWEKDHVMNMTGKLLQELTGKTFPLPSSNDYLKIHQNLPEVLLELPTRYIVFSLFGSVDNRSMPDETTISLLSLCHDRFPLCKLIIAGSPKDHMQAQKLIDSLPDIAHNVINLCGKTNYFELYHLAKNADFMIGIDSGVTHFGAIFSPHTFVVVRKHLPELFWPYPDDFMNKITVITDETCQCSQQCLPCLRKYSPTPCMQYLPAEKIFNAINEVICAKSAC